MSSVNNPNLSSQQEIWVTTPNGHGSTGTKARIYTVTQVNAGSPSLTYTSDATNGDKITVNVAGVYAFYMSDTAASTPPFGVTRNGDATVNVNSQSAGVTLSIGTVVANTALCSCGGVQFLSAGDILRAQDQGTCNGTTGNFGFRVTRIF